MYVSSHTTEEKVCTLGNGFKSHEFRQLHDSSVHSPAINSGFNVSVLTKMEAMEEKVFI